MMRSTILAVLSSLALAFHPAPPAWAHGGTFPPPPPGPGWAPGDTVPRPSSGAGPGPIAAPPGGLTPPSQPSTGVGPSVPSPGAAAPAVPSGPNTPGGSSPLGGNLDLTLWTWWWEFNKEPFLELKGHLYADPATSGSDGFFLGRGERTRATGDRRPGADQIRELVVPALVQALGAESANDVATGCLVALARIGEDYPGPDRVEIQNVLRPYLASPNQEVAETATAALGILGHESSALFLSELLLDTSAGRKEVGKSSVDLRTRAFAAYALGLIGIQTRMEDVRRYVVHKLTRALETDETATPDLGVACVLSLGRIPLEWSGKVPDKNTRRDLIATASREAQILYLLDVLNDKKRDRIVRAHCPTALAFLLTADAERYHGRLREQVAKDLLERFDPRKREPRELRQSIAIALGMIGENDDGGLNQDIRRALEGADGDVQVRHFATLSLGRVAARPGQGAPHDVDAVRSELLGRLGRDGTDLARWSALALALFERGSRAAGYPSSGEVGHTLQLALSESTAPLDVGALSIACGIVGDPQSADPLLRELRRIDDDRARGFAAIGLGLVDARGAVDEIRRVVEESTYRPTLLREAAISLGLLGDRNVVSLLTGELAQARSLASQASIAQALGRIGDASSIAPLIELLRDQEKTASARAFAAVALGIVADQDELPWNTILSVDLNYTAAPATLYDQGGFGILNIL